MTHYCLFPTPLGDCGIAWRDDIVIGTRLPDTSTPDSGVRLAAMTGATPGEPPAEIRSVIASITALLSGERTDLSFIRCDFSGIDAFSTSVYAATRAIPAGETRTYGAIALQLGNKQLSQQVGKALGRNPFPIIVPCHRVLGANGKLTGFSAPGGVKTKLRLLEIERARFGDAPGLFDDVPPGRWS